MVEQGGAALHEGPTVQHAAERIARGQFAQLGLQGLVGADVKAPQQVGQLALDVDEAGRQ